MKDTYVTLSETVNALKVEGYSLEFNINQRCLICDQPKLAMSPGEFKIDAVYRFEGACNPDDQAILYAISSRKHSIKGVLANGCGISTVEAINTKSKD